MTSYPKALSIIATVMAGVFAPPEPMVPSAWATQMVVPDGPRAGSEWDSSLTPYVPPVIDLLSPDSPHNLVVVKKSAQTGLSVAGLALVGSYIDEAPARLGYALPTIDALQEFNREKLTPVIEQTRSLRRKVKPQTSRSSTGSTGTSKKFAGGSLTLVNANSAKDLRSKTLKVGVADEVDEWEADLEGQGDPWELFLARFMAFHATGDWKVLAASTPTLHGSSRIDDLYLAGDQRKLHVLCPHCGDKFVFEFRPGETFRFNRTPPHGAYYVAPCCGGIVEHHQKASLVREACAAKRFKPTNPDGLYPSFHIDTFLSQLTTWDKMAEAWVKAEGNERKEKAFFNLWLGLSYEMRGDAPDHIRLMERREDYPENRIPAAALLLTAGADVQHNGIWVEVIGFAPDRQSWTVSARFLEGDTTDIERGAWAKLNAVYDERFVDAFGNSRVIDAMAVDAGDGGRTNQVYAWTLKRSRSYAIRGVGGWTAPAIGVPSRMSVTVRGRKLRRGALSWPIGTWSLKAEYYDNLRKDGRRGGQESDPPGYCHHGEFLDETYFKQTTAEYLADKKINGRMVKKWIPTGENHLLDCRIYGMAMAEHMGLTRKTADQWAELAQRYGVSLSAHAPDLFETEAIKAERVSSATASQAKQPTARMSLAEIARKLNS